MDNKIKKYVINLLLTTVLGGVIGFLNYLFNVGLARFTSESIFSIYAGAIGIVYLIQIPATSIQNILTKAIGETPNGDIAKFRIKSFIIFSILGSLFGVIFLLLTPLIANTASIPEYVIPSLAITFALAFISPIAKGILLGKEQIIKVNLILLSETLLRFAIGFLAIKLNGDINLIILANALPSFVSCILILPLIKTKKENTTDIKINIKELILMTVSFLLLSAP
jgi:O-antigen/teichoic acid export membrane protein